MPNLVKQNLLSAIEQKYGKLKKLSKSLSLYDLGEGLARIYVRYSKVHSSRNQTFYGLRKKDLKELEGNNSVICFLWDKQSEPLFLPFSDFEDVFDEIEPASDGQYKVQIFFQTDATELYISNAGRFNIENFIGWQNLDLLIDKNKLIKYPELNHYQIQTLIGSIGVSKGYNIWIPQSDRMRLDWSLSQKFICMSEIPSRYESISDVVKNIDVLWVKRGSSELRAMFEVEYSTPIYSGLLRFNDLHLVEPNLKPKFNIVSNDNRRSLFLKQINRPTFTVSGLSKICNFLNYKGVYGWFNRIVKEQT